ncbi:hypothetical protein JCM19239_1198 [Vibrio variabilis]|uniref:Uncharacterized protein n=1 Tax=Vibrio variabilis TaxID=990271 RepID=A0ABQ0JAQ2_9VIBR|nr:hypothetical protein JCM19239_1198 [Vibrio variabilis]
MALETIDRKSYSALLSHYRECETNSGLPLFENRSDESTYQVQGYEYG